MHVKNVIDAFAPQELSQEEIESIMIEAEIVLKIILEHLENE